MALNFQDLKFIDQHEKDLVAGYFKTLKQETDIIIPSIIVSITILFYHAKEFFTVCGSHMKIDKNSLRVTTFLSSRLKKDTCYGNIPINDQYDCIYSWTFQIIEKNRNRVEIGIDTSNKQRINKRFTSTVNVEDNDTLYYAYGSNAVLRSHRHKSGDNTYIDGTKFEKGDILKMVLNTKNKTLQFFINDELQGARFDDVEFKEDKDYYLAISMCTHQQSNESPGCVELISFEQKLC